MYSTLLLLHNYTRWLVLASLLLAIFRAYKGYSARNVFSGTDNAIRHWTATIAHIQFMIGMVLYFKSSVVKHFFATANTAASNFEFTFFGLVHSLLMFGAIVLISIGSAKAKREETDHQKFKTMLIWFSIALLIIFVAIPWPFSPFANRPYLR